jgi:hypothetical protein
MFFSVAEFHNFVTPYILLYLDSTVWVVGKWMHLYIHMYMHSISLFQCNYRKVFKNTSQWFALHILIFYATKYSFIMNDIGSVLHTCVVLVTIPHYSMCSLLWHIFHIHCDMTPIQSGGKCDLFVYSHPEVSYDFPYNGLILTTREGLISVFMYAPCSHLSHLIVPYHSWLRTLCKTEVSFFNVFTYSSQLDSTLNIYQAVLSM